MGTVYDTRQGRVCPGCEQPIAQCGCRDAGAILGDGRVRIVLDTKGRGGKAVTVISGLALDAAGLKSVAKALKKACGAGGTVKDGTIEVQGDRREQAATYTRISYAS